MMIHALSTSQVVANVCDKIPSTFLNVTYDNNFEVQIGRQLKSSQIKDQPSVKWDSDENTYYTLCMTDPEASDESYPKSREWHRWLVVNIPGSEVSKGEVLSKYVGFVPLEDTGVLRYVFLVYQQPEKLNFDKEHLTNSSGDNCDNFSIKKFASKYNLGDPIAVNMFQVNFEASNP